MYLGSRYDDAKYCNYLCRLLARLKVISYEEWFDVESGIAVRRSTINPINDDKSPGVPQSLIHKIADNKE